MRKNSKKDRVLDALESVLAAIETDTAALKRLAWAKPWSNPARNLKGRPYAGGNVHILNIVSIYKGYKFNRWGTIRQINALGGKVNKGESATPVYYYNVVDKTKIDEDGNEKTEKYWIFKYFNVFNVGQCEGIKVENLPAGEYSQDEYLTPGRVLSRYQKHGGPEVVEAGDRACYSPTKDTVTIPPRETFHSPEGYASTLYHELVHSTGHSSRLDRTFGSVLGVVPEDETYPLEELVAETGALLLCDHTGITPNEDNFKAYIASWLGAIRSDKRYKTFSALSAAQKAVDYIIGETV